MDKNVVQQSISHHGYPKIKTVVNNIALRCFKNENGGQRACFWQQ